MGTAEMVARIKRQKPREGRQYPAVQDLPGFLDSSGTSLSAFLGE